jgi:hypothetical protein
MEAITMAGTTRRKPGWMGPYIESLRARLLERGYTPGSTKQILTLAGQLGRWMQTADVKFSQLDSAAVASFLDSLRAQTLRDLVRSLLLSSSTPSTRPWHPTSSGYSWRPTSRAGSGGVS